MSGRAQPETSLDRRTAVALLLAGHDDVLVVPGLGSATWDCAALGDNPLHFSLWGAMGNASMIGLGLALAQPARRVLVLTGDGDMLMGLASLATIATQAPSNLALVVLDNERHGETGMHNPRIRRTAPASPPPPRPAASPRRGRSRTKPASAPRCRWCTKYPGRPSSRSRSRPSPCPASSRPATALTSKTAFVPHCWEPTPPDSELRRARGQRDPAACPYRRILVPLPMSKSLALAGSRLIPTAASIVASKSLSARTTTCSSFRRQVTIVSLPVISVE